MSYSNPFYSWLILRERDEPQNLVFQECWLRAFPFTTTSPRFSSNLRVPDTAARCEIVGVKALLQTEEKNKVCTRVHGSVLS